MTTKYQQRRKGISNARLPSSFVEGLFAEGVALHRAGQLDDAERTYGQVIALKPDHFDCLRLLGTVSLQRGNYTDALHRLETALRRGRNCGRPNLAEVHANLGVALHQLKRYKEALASHNRALALLPDYAEALSNRGNTLKEQGQYEDALASYDRAIELRPHYAEALSNRGNVLRALGRFEEALADYDHALVAEPDFIEVLLNRGVLLFALKRFDEALESYDRALAKRPDFIEAQLNRGIALKEMKRLDEALASCELALAIRPGSAEAYANKGNVLKEVGRLEDARSCYKKALQFDPNLVAGYFNLADTITFTSGDPHLVGLETLARIGELSKDDRMQLDFALGKAYADLGDYSRSFKHLLSGNGAKRATIAYDEKSTFAWLARIEAVFTRELVEAKSGHGNPSQMPIFVLGMPRSGTTLIEQIVASHPTVYGAGELMVFHDVVATFARRNSDGKSVDYPEFVSELSDIELDQIGARYLSTLRHLVSSWSYDRGMKYALMTDKMPSNYYFIGLIHLALPNAKIIHVVRDPIDTCVSCFSKLFYGEQSYSYDLAEMGRYYKRYQQLMAHWSRVLPIGRILEIRYEDVVADFERQARRIISHCQLPWDDHCLAFDKSDRVIGTASAVQVRQPIYRSSVGRWRMYEDQLEPLLRALEETQHASADH
jgi:tetratricopeptide (TPR) repeat protein